MIDANNHHTCEVSLNGILNKTMLKAGLMTQEAILENRVLMLELQLVDAQLAARTANTKIEHIEFALMTTKDALSKHQDLNTKVEC